MQQKVSWKMNNRWCRGLVVSWCGFFFVPKEGTTKSNFQWGNITMKELDAREYWMTAKEVRESIEFADAPHHPSARERENERQRNNRVDFTAAAVDGVSYRVKKNRMQRDHCYAACVNCVWERWMSIRARCVNEWNGDVETGSFPAWISYGENVTFCEGFLFVVNERFSENRCSAHYAGRFLVVRILV